jgi:N-acetylneuraminic acid mutarotase
MKKNIYFRLFPWVSLLMVGLVLFMLPDCGSKTLPSPKGKTGSILVRWGPNSSQAEDVMYPFSNGFDCGVYGIETVDADVYDENGEFLVQGGPWNCEDQEGIIRGVEPGSDRTVILMARNIAGDILFRDELTGVSVSAGQTTFPGDFSLDPVSPYVSSWVITASMPYMRYGHTATLLNDSKVLVAGGSYYEPVEGVTYYRQCALYDPVAHVWNSTASLQIERANHRSVLLSDGRVLVCGGTSEIEGVRTELPSCEIYDPVSGTWSTAQDMLKPRTGHTATLMQNGRVLVTGGYNGDDGYLPDCEVYNPETNMWLYTGFLNHARWAHGAARFDDGTVLIIGGYLEDDEYESEILSSCEIYDPDTGTCTLIEQEMSAGRSGPVVTTLSDGRIAVFGGYAGSGYNNQSCEIFDPESQSWTLHDDTIRERAGFSATLLPNGEVLIAGGDDQMYFQCFCELFNPQTGVYTYTDGMLQRTVGHTDTLLHDATVLVTGGYLASGTAVSRCEFYQFEYPADDEPPEIILADPAADDAGVSLSSEIRLTIRDPLPENGSFHGVDRESIGVVIGGVAAISGGVFQDEFDGLIVPDEIGGYHITIDPDNYFVSGQTVTVTVDATDHAPVPNAIVQEEYSFTCTDSNWSFTGSMNQGRSSHTMTKLPDGRVLVAGGIFSGYPVSSSEIFDPDTGNWIQIPEPMNLERYLHRATHLQNGSILVTGGHMGEWQTETCELFDPEIGAWTMTDGMSVYRSSHTATLLADGRVLVAGGYSGDDYLDSCEIYDPATGEWTATGSLNQARSAHQAVLLSDGSVLVIGGSYEDELEFYALSSCEEFDPATGTWSFLENELNTGRSGPNLEVLADGKLIVLGGFIGSGMWTLSCEIYDPDATEPVWEDVESMIVDRMGGCSVVLDSGLVMLVGGSRFEGIDIIPITGCELYDPASDTWSETSALIVARQSHGAIVLENGKVLVTGGFDSPASLSTCELYEP